MNKNFTDDFGKFHQMLLTGKNFSINRYGDGEMLIMQKKLIDILGKANGEFRSDPNDETDKFYIEKLTESFRYKHQDYYVGIGCPCCVGPQNFSWMRDTSGQDEEHLTWANIFVNSNNPLYNNLFISEYKKKDIILVCHRKADITRLPFKVKKDFRVGVNAWKNDYGLIETMKTYIKENSIKNHVFLFCAGPFSKMLVHQLLECSQDNTYLDIGSTLDPMMGLGMTRSYHTGRGQYFSRTCVWG